MSPRILTGAESRLWCKPGSAALIRRRIPAKLITLHHGNQGHVMASKAELQKAPQPTVDRVEELAARILNGDIILPKFQREFVWSKRQVIELWDSIARNYPIGSVLLWRSRETLRAE